MAAAAGAEVRAGAVAVCRPLTLILVDTLRSNVLYSTEFVTELANLTNEIQRQMEELLKQRNSTKSTQVVEL